ncbi:MAG: CBS domain-containing protein [Nitrospiria bacterium]
MRQIDYCVGGKNIAEIAASHIMETDVISSGEETSCHDLADSLFKRGFGSIPVIDQNRVLKGLVSEYDILNALVNGKDLRKTSASTVMTQSVVTIKEETPIMEVIALLQARHLIRVPVVDPEGKLIGIVARRDILGCYYESTFGPLPSF